MLKLLSLLALTLTTASFAADSHDGLTYQCVLDSARSSLNLGELEFKESRFSMSGTVSVGSLPGFHFTVDSLRGNIGPFDPSAKYDIFMTDYAVSRTTTPEGNVRVSSMLVSVPRADSAVMPITLYFPNSKQHAAYRCIQKN